MNEESPKEVCLDIVGRLDKRWNLDLKAILSNEALDEKTRLKKLRARMLEAALSEIDQVHADIEYQPKSQENDKLVQSVLAEEDIEIEPNVSVIRSNYDIIRNYQGQQVYDYVYTLSKRLESMSKAKTPGQLAVETVASTLFTVGTSWAKLTWNAWRTGETLL